MSTRFTIDYTYLENVNGPHRPERLEKRHATEELWLSAPHDTVQTAKSIFEKRYRGQTAKLVRIIKHNIAPEAPGGICRQHYVYSCALHLIPEKPARS